MTIIILDNFTRHPLECEFLELKVIRNVEILLHNIAENADGGAEDLGGQDGEAEDLVFDLLENIIRGELHVGEVLEMKGDDWEAIEVFGHNPAIAKPGVALVDDGVDRGEGEAQLILDNALSGDLELGEELLGDEAEC
ncbi:manganese superoxide dismutase 1 [Striga asiatica]|uniref:Manganese superoxide dismutase 1 n=1 Tax=Striga asiatica TaxID=4170 RepID=A0A5A7QTU3_STRAF|nr:manganese superoxide dismutase 1 [Striga asiatica]